MKNHIPDQSDPEAQRIWDAVHRAMDNREDPLENPRLQADLLERPDLLEGVAELRNTVWKIRAASPGSAAPFTKKRQFATWSLAAAILVLGVSIGLVFLFSTDEEGPTPSPLHTAGTSDDLEDDESNSSVPGNPRSAGWILSSVVTSTIQTPTSVTESTWDGRTFSRTTRLLNDPFGSRRVLAKSTENGTTPSDAWVVDHELIVCRSAGSP